MKRFLSPLFKHIFILTFALLFGGMVSVYGANRYSVATGNWNSSAVWSATSGGAPGVSVPIAGDVVYINNGHTVTVTVNAACTSVTFTGANATLLVNSGFTLAVSGAVTLNNAAAANVLATISGAGTVTCASANIGNGTTATGNNSTYTHTIASAIAAFTISGNITINSYYANNNRIRNGVFTQASGTVTINGSLSTANANGSNTSTYTLGNSSPTLILGGTAPFAISGTGISTVTLNGTGATVNYNRARDQTARPATYENLTVSGTGIKTFATATTVNGMLLMEGTATISTAPTYGTNATLQYNTATARNAGLEWITPFVASGGVVIANTGAITMNAAKVLNATAPLTINIGATLNMSTFLLTLNGSFINNGGAAIGSGGVIVTGAANQSIGMFANTGTVSMTKAGGVATLVGNVSGGGFTINGSGGTMNLGSGLTHTFTGIFTVTAGTLNANSSTLKLGGQSNATGGIFETGTGTVEWNGASVQTIPPFVYYDLTVNNTAGVQLGGNANINGALTFTNGKITTGTHSLILGNSATVNGAGSGKYVYGNLVKGIATATTTKTFEIGDASVYAPVTLGFAGNTNGTGSITANTTAVDHPNIGSSGIEPTLSLNRYWALLNTGVSGFTFYDATFTFVPGDIDSGADYSTFMAGKYTSSAWSYPTSGTVTSTNAQTTGLTTFGDFLFGKSFISSVACQYGDNGSTPVVPNVIPCVNLPSNPQTVSTTFAAHQYFTMNVIKGMTYQVYTCNTSSPAFPLMLAVYKEGASSDPILSFSFSNTGNPCTGVANNVYTSFTPSFSGQVRVLINMKENCSSYLPAGLTVMINVSGGSNSQDNQSAAGADTWVGHVYDGTNAGVLFDGSFQNYLGYYSQNETFNEVFGGNGNDTDCFGPINSDETNRANLLTLTYSVRYRMTSSKRGLWVATIGSDDGARLAVDGSLIYGAWNDRAYGLNSEILMSLTGASSLVLDYYENVGDNQVSFQYFTQVLGNYLSANTSQNVCLGSPGATISGDTYGILPTGIALSGTGYQWNYSTTPLGARINISGATGASFTPNTSTAPFDIPGTYYLYRNAVLSSTNNGSQNPFVAAYESNVATVTVNTKPTVSITGGTVICAGSITTLSPGTGGTWTSSNTTLATVTNGGIVTGIAEGSATFTFTETLNGCSNTTSAVTIMSSMVTSGVLTCIGGSGSLSVSTACSGTTYHTSVPKNAGTGISVVGVGTLAWTNPGYITTVGSPYVTAIYSSGNSPIVSNYLEGTNYGFSIPSSATITGIEVSINRTSNREVYDQVVSLILNGNIVGDNKAALSIPWPTTMENATYGTSSDMWLLSASTLTPAMVNASNFGVAMVAQKPNGTTRIASVDYILVTVSYSNVGTINWYNVPSGGTPIGTGPSFNPVGVSGGLPDTNTAGIFPFYAECSSNNGCRARVDFVIDPLPIATFSYTGSPYCDSAANPLPTFSGGGVAGTFSSTQGLVFVSADTGEIDKAASTPGTYSVTNTIPSGCGNVTATTVVTVGSGGYWTGALDMDWNNPGNWGCNQIPALATNVIIGSGKPNYPVLFSGSAGTVNDLTIESGASVTVTGNTLQIAGDISNGGTFTATEGTIEMRGSAGQSIGINDFAGNTVMNLTINNSAGVTLQGPLQVTGIVTAQNGNLFSGGNLTLVSTSVQTALIDVTGSGDVLGNVNMQRYLSSAFGYKYFSSPFQSATVAEFADEVNLSAAFPALYRYNENNSIDTSGVTIYTSGWAKYVQTGDPLVSMAGYAANLGADPAAASMTASMIGIVNNGNLQTALFNHNRQYTKGFSLVGNPYPSPIDWNAPGWTKTNIDNALYFFNASGSQYSGAYSSYVNGVSSGNADHVIAAMQGFFVHVTDGTYPVGGTLGVTNLVRINNLNPVFKSAVIDTRAILRFSANFETKHAIGDAAVIYFDPTASIGFDKDLDALKMTNTDPLVPNLYTLAPDATQLQINGMPYPSDSTSRISLGITTFSDGWINFKAEDVSQLPSYLHIYLVDGETSKQLDLRQVPDHLFYLKGGEYNRRFTLVFSLSELSQQAITAGKVFTFSRSGDYLRVKTNLPFNTSGNLLVTNILGKVIMRKEVFEKETVEINQNVSTGVYVITLHAGKITQSEKILMRKDYE